MVTSDEERAAKILRKLLNTVRFAVLATQGETGPYTSLVGIVPGEDASRVAFATDRETSKYKNLMRNPHASMMVDSRGTEGGPVESLAAVTVVGTVEELSGEEAAKYKRALEKRVPALGQFLSAAGCAVMALQVERCHVVSGFQSGSELQADI